jgi:hypothetical protein
MYPLPATAAAVAAANCAVAAADCAVAAAVGAIATAICAVLSKSNGSMGYEVSVMFSFPPDTCAIVVIPTDPRGIMFVSIIFRQSQLL